jgi:molybdenum cofactor guanylyltransferase
MTRETAVGVVLAGGRSARMGGRDKAFVELAGRPLIAHVLERLVPQVSTLVVSANGQPESFAAHGVSVVADTVGGFAGPLAGILAGMTWAGDHVPGAKRIATVAVDTPFFPKDLVARLANAVGSEGVAVARSSGRVHPTFVLVPLILAGDLAAFLAVDGSRRVSDWLAGYGPTAVDFEARSDGSDPFFNINTPEDLAAVAACAVR